MPSIKMEDRRGYASRVCHKFDKFWQWKLPCPVDPFEDIYRAAYTDKQWIAMRYLMEHKRHVMKQDKSFNLYWATDCNVSFKFPIGIKLPTTSVQLDELPDSVQCRVRPWVTSVQRFRMLRKELRDRINGVMGNPNGRKYHMSRSFKDLDPKVNTPKQLYRVWPELQPMFLPEWKRDVQLQSVRSPLPKLLGYEVKRPRPSDGFMQSRWCTVPEFRCEDVHATVGEKQSWKEINDILLMVSLAGDVPNVENYPSFSGGID